MWRKFKIFCKDYHELCKHGLEWYKKHWIGYTIACLVYSLGVFAWFFRGSIKDGIKEHFNTKIDCVKEEEEEA